MVLGSRHGRLHNGRPNLLDEEGDAYMPELQGDLGTYNTVNGCVERQEDAVLRGGFASEEAAAENVKALRMVWAFDQLKPQATTAAHRCTVAPPLSDVPAASDVSRARILSLQMHNQMAIVKANIMPRYKMGSLETERVQQGFSVFKPSREGQHFRAKKELSLRRLLAYCGCLLRRFHIYEREKWVDKCKLAADGKVSCCSLTSAHIFLCHPSVSRHLRCTITLGALPVFAVPRPSRFSPTVAQDGARVQRRRGDGGDEQGSVRRHAPPSAGDSPHACGPHGDLRPGEQMCASAF
eukprot:1044023-Prymnesium_polylepis.1